MEFKVTRDTVDNKVHFTLILSDEEIELIQELSEAKNGSLAGMINGLLSKRSAETINKTNIKTERDKARVLLEIIKDLSEEYGGRVPINVVMDEMSKHWVSERKVEKIIIKLKQQGLIIEPSQNYLKTV